MTRMIQCFVLLCLAGACTSSTIVDTGVPYLPFCEKMEDANSHGIEVGGGSGTSGSVIGRVITDESQDLHDPQWVGFLDYTIDNIDVGGTQQQGETQQDGAFVEVLGAGNWRFKISATQAGFTCANEIEFQVESGNTTQVCVDVNCI